jgi:thioredoxin 1
VGHHQPARRKGRPPGPPSPESDRVAPGKRTLWRVAVLLGLVAAVALVLAGKPAREDRAAQPSDVPLAASHDAAPPALGIPRLVDIGADRCIPCKAMAPILEELRTEYAGRMQVDFVDVWKNPSAGAPYRVYGIPTQIFFDEHGRELTRHHGFLSKEDILATWRRVGYDFSLPGRASPAI